MKSLIVRKPLLAYFLLAYAFFWSCLIAVMIAFGLLGVHPQAVSPAWMSLVGILSGLLFLAAAAVVSFGRLKAA
jgi:hypothetical protein